VIFISNNDNLFPGALSEYLKIIIDLEPQVALINFNQLPFTIKSRLYKDTIMYKQQNFEFLKPLILFP
jgi:hypothetical protein